MNRDEKKSAKERRQMAALSSTAPIFFGHHWRSTVEDPPDIEALAGILKIAVELTDYVASQENAAPPIAVENFLAQVGKACRELLPTNIYVTHVSVYFDYARVRTKNGAEVTAKLLIAALAATDRGEALDGRMVPVNVTELPCTHTWGSGEAAQSIGPFRNAS